MGDLNFGQMAFRIIRNRSLRSKPSRNGNILSHAFVTTYLSSQQHILYKATFKEQCSKWRSLFDVGNAAV